MHHAAHKIGIADDGHLDIERLTPSIIHRESATDMRQLEFEVRGEFITLDSLLKATGLADSGGSAKAMVASGLVQVDGRDELRKTCKVRAGQVVSVHGARIRVVQAADPASPAQPAGPTRPRSKLGR